MQRLNITVLLMDGVDGGRGGRGERGQQIRLIDVGAVIAPVPAAILGNQPPRRD